MKYHTTFVQWCNKLGIHGISRHETYCHETYWKSWLTDNKSRPIVHHYADPWNTLCFPWNKTTDITEVHSITRFLIFIQCYYAIIYNLPYVLIFDALYFHHWNNVVLQTNTLYSHIDGLVQEIHNSSALAVELCLSCISPSICYTGICEYF